MEKINFTKEHQSRLEFLFLFLCFSIATIAGVFGANTYNPADLLYNSSLSTLRSMNITLKKKIEALETTDEWSMTDSTQRSLKEMKLWQEYINLLIGHKTKQYQDEKVSIKIRELKSMQKELQESSKTPAEKLLEIQKQIEELSS